MGARASTTEKNNTNFAFAPIEEQPQQTATAEGVVKKNNRARLSKNECDSSYDNVEHVPKYCDEIIMVRFNGQSNPFNAPDESDLKKNRTDLGVYIEMLDSHLRQCNTPDQLDVKDEEFQITLRLVAYKRRRSNETTDECLTRLCEDAEKFQKIYQERAKTYSDRQFSEALDTQEYWGTRQQLLSGKVICDWLNYDDDEPMDPIFGALLNPTAGRVGPGDTDWIHSLLYDDFGKFAYHSAVHDAFGYLVTYHKIGPGYDYLSDSMLSKDNPMAGQISGLQFWSEKLEEIGDKLNVIEAFKNV